MKSWLACAMLIVASGVAWSQDARTEPSGITVTGSASRDVEPDRVSITVGVMTERPGTADASNENARAARAIVDTIVAAGIDRRDIKTTASTLAPIYTPTTGTSSVPAVRAYRASNQVNVIVRQIDATGPLIQKLVDKSITNLSGPNFEVSNAETITDDLRGEAAKDARRKAEIIATALGVRLGRVLDVRTDGPSPRPMFRAAAAPMRAAAAAPPVESGVERLSTDVTVTFEIAP